MPRSPIAMHRHDIEGLRAIAVLFVVVHHAAPALLPGGFAGVDVFFVISGFLITGLIERALQAGSFRYSEFLLKRCRRILPSLVTVLVATLLLGACILTGPELVSLARHTMAGALSASNVLLFTEVGYFDASAAGKPLLHLWSLGVEEQFYLLWPVLLLLLPRSTRTRALSIAAVLVGSLWVSEELAFRDPAQSFYLLHSRAWELAAGGLLSFVPGAALTRLPKHITSAAAWLGLVMIAAAGLTLSETTTWPGISALVPVVGTVLLIGAGPAAFPNRTLLTGRMQAWLGQRSYALYLWHWPPLAFLHILGAERALDTGTQGAIAVALILVALTLAHLTVVHVELPIRYRSSSGPVTPPAPSLGLLRYAAIIGVIVLTGYGVVHANGIPARYGAISADAMATLREASADSIVAYDRIATRCKLPDAGNAVWCWRTAGDGPGVAVIGDSHAEVVFAGLAERTPRLPLFLTGRKGCAPILQVEPIPDRLSDICRRAMQLSHDAIVRDERIGTVVMVARGPAYTSGIGFGVDTQRPVVRVTAPGDSFALRRAYAAGLDTSVGAFISAGKRVIYLVGVPEIGFLPEECLVGRPLGLRSIRRPCEVRTSDVSRRNAVHREVLAGVKARHPALEIVDATPIFCDSNRCDVERGRRLLYQDGNHLSLRGSRLVATTLLRRINGPPDRALLATAGQAASQSLESQRHDASK
jgi:peptidoglycan/LPS O-acetylase OafA/YrhL